MLGMPNCKEVTRLVSESMEHKLPFRKRISLWMHLSMCKLCGGFRKELQMIQDAARQQAESIEKDTDATPGESSLSNDARERIRRALDSANARGRES